MPPLISRSARAAAAAVPGRGGVCTLGSAQQPSPAGGAVASPYPATPPPQRCVTAFLMVLSHALPSDTFGRPPQVPVEGE